MVAQLDFDYIRTRPFKALSRLMSHVLFQGRPLTTGWRWINPIVLAQFRFVKNLPQLKRVHKPIFILGTGRSGSTILGKLLSIHSQVLFLNEAKALWHIIHSEEDLIGSYSRGRACYRLAADQATTQVYQIAHRLYGYCLALTGSQRILDKHGEMIFRIPFVRELFPDAKLIFLVRNGWDTVGSIATWSRHNSRRVGNEVHDWWGTDRRKWHLLVKDVIASDPAFTDVYTEVASFTQHEDMAAVEWIASMREGIRLMQSMPEFIYQVFYEDLVTHPEKTLKKLLVFCELPEDKALISYAQRVLNPVPPKELLTLSPSITPLFLETMKALNYPAGEETEQLP